MSHRLQVFYRLFSYLRPYWANALLVYGATVLAVLLNLYIPQLIKQAIDEGIALRSMPILWQAAGLIIFVSIVRGVVSFIELYGSEWLTHQFAYDLRNDFYNALQYLPFSFHDRQHTGDLMSRATSDISESERFIGIGAVNLISTVLLLVGVMGGMFIENPLLASIATLPMLVLVLVALRFGIIVETLFKALQQQMGVISKTMQESLTGINLVKAFAREPYELSKFDQENMDWFKKREEVITTWANNWPFMGFLVTLSILLLLWFGGPLVLSQQVTVGSLFAMISYVLLLNGPVQRLGFLVNQAATCQAAASRIFEILDLPHEGQIKNEVELTDVKGGVRFENVSFAYQGNQMRTLRDISFEIRPGQTVALLGPTGSGKSTLINLLSRFYEVSSGRILIDGHDISRVSLASLRRHIGLVLQDNFLFSANIADNIAYGRPKAPREEIQAAAEAARAHDFIQNFPKGYDTMVGERGVTLSGGQKQRIAIARALLTDPRILILDDSTSSVDTETEYLIQQALDVLMHGRTTFVIAQRLLTLKKADLILVLDEGQIVERGTHDQLLANNGLYKKIYDLQLKDQEELANMKYEV